MATLADLRQSFPFLSNISVVNDEGDPLKGEIGLSVFSANTNTNTNDTN